MSDNEEDYMSDKFLAKLDDVRPSLIQNRCKKRQIDIEIKQQNIIKRQREERGNTRKSQNELLQESLKQAITEDNKGFQLLAKMGYKPGQALGKQSKTNDKKEMNTQRLTEPLRISIKEDRGGLGREAAISELKEKLHQLRQQRLIKKLGGEDVSTEEFRRRAAAKAEERFVLGALRGSQKTCEILDTAAKVNTPEMSWFWPEQEAATDSSEDEPATNDELAEEKPLENEIQYTASEKLEILTSYLRTAYMFCFWCGIKYNDVNDLDSNCPGLTRDEH